MPSAAGEGRMALTAASTGPSSPRRGVPNPGGREGGRAMLREAWALARDTVEGFIADEAMTRGAAIACYAMFSIAPLLVVAVAIAGLAFGEEAVRSAVGGQLRALVGREGAEAVQAMVRGVGEGGGPNSTGVPALVSVAVLL